MMKKESQYMVGDLPQPDIEDNQEKKTVDKSDPIVTALLETDFVTEETLAATGPENATEYQVVKLLLSEGGMTQEDLESKIDHPLLPVAVKNLTGVEIITEEGGKYKISDKSNLS